jgi:hypothetical protein
LYLRTTKRGKTLKKAVELKTSSKLKKTRKLEMSKKPFWHWCTIVVPSFLADFEIIPIEAFEARFMGGWERGSGGGAPC